MTLENCSNIFDKEFSQKNVLYYPWVGKDYCKTSPKVLIVGESHYYSPNLIDDPVSKTKVDNDHNFTRDCFLEQYNVYSNTQAVLSNNLIDNEYIANKIVFYNFFSHCVGYGASDKQFVKEYLDESRELFYTILDIVKPQIVFVWGTSEMWGWMPQDSCCLFDYDSKNYRYEKYPDIDIIHVVHPSRDKDLCYTAKTIKYFFEKNKFKYPL